MRNPKYLLAAVAIGALMFFPRPTLASPLSAGLSGADLAVSEIASGPVEKVHKRRYKKHRHYSHRRHRRHYRRFYDDDDYYYPYFSYYCDDYYGYDCGYPRRYRHPGFIIISPHFGIGFGF